MRCLLFLSIIFFLTRCKSSESHLNGGFETIDKAHRPVGWVIRGDSSGSYIKQLDSNIKQNGKYSLSIEKAKDGAEFGAFYFPIEKTFEGANITLSGYIKTKDINTGYAGLWARVDDALGNSLILKNMSDGGAKGSTDWKRYVITVPYNSAKAGKLSVGGLLVGDGKAWFDQLEVQVDGKTLKEAKISARPVLKAQTDTFFNASSRINDIKLNYQTTKNLTVTGQFWSFLKYHHPAIARGDYNWDAELFRLLPTIINAQDNNALSEALETFIKKLPTPRKCTNCLEIANKQYFIKPDYGLLFDSGTLNKTLIERLTDVRDNRNIGPNYYVTLAPIGNPDFHNEWNYWQMTYPDAGYRILALYKYWGIINYFFPSRQLIGENWNQVLSSALPEFINAKNEKEYMLAMLKLVSRIKDSHAALYGPNKALLEFKGKFILPLQASFIENKLLILALHSDTLGLKKRLKVGDEIIKINDVTINHLVQKLLPYTSSSNYDTQLRDLSRSLIRSNQDRVKLTINRNGKQFEYSVPTLSSDFGYKDILFEKAEAFKIMDGNIGYVFPGKYKNSMLAEISRTFNSVKGIIIDMRCYPSEFMPFTFGNYIKKSQSPFVHMTQAVIDYPGSFNFIAPIENGFRAYAHDGSPEPFKGNVVVIVNSTSQSQAEYTTMAFQSSANVKVVGSTTAGADGDVSEITLPGGLVTRISGLGIYYPDGTAAQRAGVKIDYKIYPTIKGIKEGRDELMEKALTVINSKY
ncbi:MAG: S41 family peptidase [Pedobacter sp.]